MMPNIMMPTLAITCERVALFCTIFRKHMAGIITAWNRGKYTFVNLSSMLPTTYLAKKKRTMHGVSELVMITL